LNGSYADQHHYNFKPGIYFSEDGAVKRTKEKVAAQRSHNQIVLVLVLVLDEVD